MLKKILFISLTVCVLFTMNQAQNIEGVNARLDGMAGAGIPDDIGWVCVNPRNFIKYPDYIQGNAVIKSYWGVNELFGRLIVLKSIGDRVVAGLTANNALMMSGDFYSRGIIFMEASGDFGFTSQDINYTHLPAFPQIGANIKITDDINVGALFMGEGIRQESEYSIVDSSVTPLVTDSLRSRKYVNLGFAIDANIGLGKFGFAPKFLLNFPRMTGEDKMTTVANETHTMDYESDAGLKLVVGTAAWFVALKYPIVGGIYYIRERYQFSKTSKGMNLDTTIQTKPFTNNIVFVFLGSEIHFGDGFMFTPELDLEFVNLHLEGLENKTAIHDSVKTYNMYTIRLGMEKKSKKLRFLDHITARAGLVYKYAQRKLKITDALGNEDITKYFVETNNDKFAQNRGTKLAAGLGITKARFTIDVSTDLMSWTGTVVTGPRAGILSLTVDIAKNPRYKMDESVSEPPPPQSEPFDSEIPASQSEQDYDEPSDDFGLDTE